MNECDEDCAYAHQGKCYAYGHEQDQFGRCAKYKKRQFNDG
jgi:hypothetical protein